MILSPEKISDTALAYLPGLRRRDWLLYYVVMAATFLGLGSLFFIRVNISVQAAGIIRPAQARTDIRPVVAGIVDSIFVRDGELVGKNERILSMQDRTAAVKKLFNEEEIVLQQNFIHDLQLITGPGVVSAGVLNLLKTPLYRQQAGRFFSQQTEQQLNLEKAGREAGISTILVQDKVISPKEFFDAQWQKERMESAYQVFRLQQMSLWQQDLLNCRLRLRELMNRQEEFLERKELCCVRSPVSGIVQGISQRYPGAPVHPDENLCSISPEGELVGECYVPTKDAGMLAKNQPVRFHIDAFNYNHFGTVGGRIFSIDNDFTIWDNKPVFRVICVFDDRELFAAGPYHGLLKKGLTFHAIFISASRTLWELLYETLDGWTNPVAPARESQEKKGT